VLEDPEGRVLLQLRDDRPDISHPDHWGLFGGRLEQDEVPSVGALRELTEELGLSLSEERLTPFGHFQMEEGKIHSVFLCRLDTELNDLVLAEGQRFAAWPPEKIAAGWLDGHPVIESHRAMVGAWQGQRETV